MPKLGLKNPLFVLMLCIGLLVFSAVVYLALASVITGLQALAERRFALPGTRGRGRGAIPSSPLADTATIGVVEDEAVAR